MAIAWTRYITQTTVLRVMQSGFALVLLLLGAACVIAVRGTHAIESDADTIVREELTIARLLNEVQAEEMTMTAVLHRLIDDNWISDSSLLLRELSEADEAVTRAAGAARHSPQAEEWVRLSEPLNVSRPPRGRRSTRAINRKARVALCSPSTAMS